MIDGSTLRQMLVEDPSERDVEHLHSPADPEDWGAYRHGVFDKTDLELVPRLVDEQGPGVRGGFVARGLDIATSGEYDSVYRAPQSAPGISWNRRKEDR